MKRVHILALILLALIGYSVLKDKTEENNLEKINDVQVKYNWDRRVEVDIYLNGPLSCGEAIKLVNLHPFNAKGIVYFPTCYNHKEWIQIIYVPTREI